MAQPTKESLGAEANADKTVQMISQKGSCLKLLSFMIRL